MRRFRLPYSLLAAVVLGLLSWMAILGGPRLFGRKPASGTAPAATRANAVDARVLGHFGRVTSTDFLMADIHSGGDRGYSSLSSLSSGKSQTIHNYVFLNVTDQSFQRLLPTNDSYIRSAVPLPEAESHTPDGPPTRVLWWFFDVVKQDTDRDGDLDEEDLGTIAVSDAGGRGYTELIGGVGEIYGRVLRDPDTLLVVYESGGAKRLGVIDLPRRALTSTTSLPDLGPDVK